AILEERRKPPVPANEEARVAALRRYRGLDTSPGQSFDDLASLASYICGAPIAMTSLVDEDRQWLKWTIVLSFEETARNVAFCAHTILEPELFQVTDALKDERFANNPLVRGETRVRFYAGVPLRTPTGEAVGAMCVMDRTPRQLSPEQ